jgi:hypothetical protein
MMSRPIRARRAGSLPTVLDAALLPNRDGPVRRLGRGDDDIRSPRRAGSHEGERDTAN